MGWKRAGERFTNAPYAGRYGESRDQYIDFGGMSWIFWGYLITAVSFRINGFDLLPSPVGFVLVAVGANGLSMYSRRFSTLTTIAIVAAFVSLTTVYQAVIPIHSVSDGMVLLLCALGIVNCVVHLWFLYLLFRGTADAAKLVDNVEVWQSSSWMWATAKWLVVLLTILSLAGLALRFFALMLLAGVGGIVWTIMLLVYCRKAYNRLHRAPIADGQG